MAELDPFDLDAVLKGFNPESSGRARPSAPSSATTTPAQSKPDSARAAAIKRVQEFLLKNNFSVRAKDPQFADGGWGPVTNDSFKKLVNVWLTLETEKATAQALVPYVSDNPKTTASSILEIEKILAANGKISATATPATPATQPTTETKQEQRPGTAPKQKDRGPIFFTVEIKTSPNHSLNRVYEDVLINEDVLSNSESLKNMMVYKGMIDSSARGRELAGQIRAATEGMLAAIPAQFPGAKKVLTYLSGELQQEAMAGQTNMHVQEYLTKAFPRELSKLPEPDRQTALFDAEQMLRRKNVLDPDGYLKSRDAARPYTDAIILMFDNYRRRVGT